MRGEMKYDDTRAFPEPSLQIYSSQFRNEYFGKEISGVRPLRLFVIFEG